jgi:hypothetical protein
MTSQREGATKTMLLSTKSDDKPTHIEAAETQQARKQLQHIIYSITGNETMIGDKYATSQPRALLVGLQLQNTPLAFAFTFLHTPPFIICASFMLHCLIFAPCLKHKRTLCTSSLTNDWLRKTHSDA